MNRGIFGGFQERYACLGHTNVTTDADGVSLPDLPNDNRVRRTVLRGDDVFTFTLDGSDPAGPSAMRAMADEVITLDTDPAAVLLAGTAVNVRVIFFGT